MRVVIVNEVFDRFCNFTKIGKLVVLEEFVTEGRNCVFLCEGEEEIVEVVHFMGLFYPTDSNFLTRSNSSLSQPTHESLPNKSTNSTVE